jgi:PAS domain-containing protein
MDGAPAGQARADEALYRAIGHLYAAAHEGHGWAAFVDAVSLAIDGHPVLYLRREASAPGVTEWASTNVDLSADARRRLIASVIAQAPDVAHTRADGQYLCGGGIDSPRIIYRAVWHARRDGVSAALVVMTHAGECESSTIYTSPDASTRVQRVLTRLQPHLGRALAAAPEQGPRAAPGMLGTVAADALAYPMLLVDADGGVLEMNARAQALVERDDRLCIRAGRLVCNVGGAREELLRAIRAAGSHAADGRENRRMGQWN